MLNEAKHQAQGDDNKQIVEARITAIEAILENDLYDKFKQKIPNYIKIYQNVIIKEPFVEAEHAQKDIDQFGTTQDQEKFADLKKELFFIYDLLRWQVAATTIRDCHTQYISKIISEALASKTGFSAEEMMKATTAYNTLSRIHPTIPKFNLDIIKESNKLCVTDLIAQCNEDKFLEIELKFIELRKHRLYAKDVKRTTQLSAALGVFQEDCDKEAPSEESTEWLKLLLTKFTGSDDDVKLLIPFNTWLMCRQNLQLQLQQFIDSSPGKKTGDKTTQNNVAFNEILKNLNDLHVKVDNIEFSIPFSTFTQPDLKLWTYISAWEDATQTKDYTTEKNFLAVDDISLEAKQNFLKRFINTVITTPFIAAQPQPSVMGSFSLSGKSDEVKAWDTWDRQARPLSTALNGYTENSHGSDFFEQALNLFIEAILTPSNFDSAASKLKFVRQISNSNIVSSLVYSLDFKLKILPYLRTYMLERSSTLTERNFPETLYGEDDYHQLKRYADTFKGFIGPLLGYGCMHECDERYDAINGFSS